MVWIMVGNYRVEEDQACWAPLYSENEDIPGRGGPPYPRPFGLWALPLGPTKPPGRPGTPPADPPLGGVGGPPGPPPGAPPGAPGLGNTPYPRKFSTTCLQIICEIFGFFTPLGGGPKGYPPLNIYSYCRFLPAPVCVRLFGQNTMKSPISGGSRAP